MDEVIVTMTSLVFWFIYGEHIRLALTSEELRCTIIPS